MAYTSLKVEVRKSKIAEKGVFARVKIKKGELICDMAGSKGNTYTGKERKKNQWGDYDIQIDDDLFFGATKSSEIETCDYINHSCEPNCGIRDALKIVAMRNIEPGEEITFDYAMSESSRDLRMKCECKKINCRKIITGDDWKRKDLRKKYDGYFGRYLQRKIDAG